MPTVLEGYNALCAIAVQGTAFRRNQVFHVSGDDPEGAQIYGHGFDFSRSVEVLNRTETALMPGTAELRVIMTPDGTLFLRTWLTWITSSGEHKSYASYEFTSETAAHLDANPPPAIDTAQINEDNVTIDEIAESVFNVLDQAAPYKANWKQIIPGLPDFDEMETFDWESWTEEQDAAAMEAKRYHARAIADAVTREPELLCMLAESDFDVVRAYHLPYLFNWVNRQPEVAAAGR